MDDTKKFKIFKVTNDEDMQKVFDVRLRGYGKYYSCSKDDMIDDLDFQPNCSQFLAEDMHGIAVGTMRVLDRRLGRIELDNFIDVDSVLHEDEKPCLEITRLSVPTHEQSLMIKLLLYKISWLYAQINKNISYLVSSTNQRAKDYYYLGFTDVGPAGEYNHPVMEDKKHITLKMRVDAPIKVWVPAQHVLADFYVNTQHPNLIIDNLLLNDKMVGNPVA